MNVHTRCTNARHQSVSCRLELIHTAIAPLSQHTKTDSCQKKSSSSTERVSQKSKVSHHRFCPRDPGFECCVYLGISYNAVVLPTAVLLLPGGHADGLTQRSDEGGQADEVAVLSAPLSPRDVVPEPARVRHRRRLGEVYHPHVGPAAVVVDEEERAANHLIGSKK